MKGSGSLRNIAARKLFGTLLIAALAAVGTNSFAQENASAPSPYGSVYVEAKVDATLVKMTQAEKLNLLAGRDNFYVRGVERIGLPPLRMSDGPAGIHNYGLTTAYPAGIALAATFDEGLSKEFGVAIGRDARARGVHFWLGPGVNLSRTVQNGRNFEYFGEDPILTSRMAVGSITGAQSQGIVATVKHFVGNEHENDRNRDNSIIAERPLHELYLRPFEAAVKEAQVWAVMSSYNLTNGPYMTANRPLVTDLLKGDWGFPGLYMSDWGATHDLIGPMKAGLDLEMPGPEFYKPEAIQAALDAGKITQEEIDAKVRRILRVYFAYNFDERSQKVNSIPLDDDANHAVSDRIAREGTVLLKNARNLLPLDAKSLKKVLVIGPAAVRPMTGGGGSSYTDPIRTVTLPEAVQNVARGLGANIEVVAKEGIPSPIMAVTASRFLGPNGESAGLRAEYFDNREFRGPAKLERQESSVSHQWSGSPAEGMPSDNFAIRWTGKYRATKAGEYTVVARSDDGIRLWLDGKVVIDSWKDRGAETDLQALQLAQGDHDIKVEYYDAHALAEVQFGIIATADLKSDVSDADLKSASAVIVTTGLGSGREGEGYDHAYELPKPQVDLVARAARLNSRTIVINHSGSPVDIKPFIDRVPAFLQAWYPGGTGYSAVAEILFGVTSPTGKLPVTWPKELKGTYYADAYPSKERQMPYDEGLFMGYRWFDKNNVEPRYPFGFGLSYTTFTVSAANAKLDNRTFTVQATVKNTGKRDGTETVQVYVGYPTSTIEHPVRELKGFGRITLKAGETGTIEIEIPRDRLAYWNTETHAWAFDPAPMEIYVGTSSRTLPVKMTLDTSTR